MRRGTPKSGKSFESREITNTQGLEEFLKPKLTLSSRNTQTKIRWVQKA
jgi:hypothetical protein